jgi:hypothetical protein
LLKTFNGLLLNGTVLTTTIPYQYGFYKMMLILAAMAVEAFERVLLYVTGDATAVSYKLGFYKMIIILAAMPYRHLKGSY